jgi:soluble lytic murein transglycosylase-like protein
VSCSEYKDIPVTASVVSPTVTVHDPRIPDLAYRLKRQVRAEVNYHWGMDQPATIFYAQIHQESEWKPTAKSPYASGLAQFTPGTAEWISKLYPADLGSNNPLDIGWAIRACIMYDKMLYDKFASIISPDTKWRFTLSSYNGGYGYVLKDQKLAASQGRDISKWGCNVEHYSTRSRSAFKENRDYLTKILDKWYPIYREAGFL